MSFNLPNVRACALIVSLLFVFTESTTAQRNQTYTNPALAGDYPDPSMIRVGPQDFWGTATSSEWAPIFPLLHSRDLVNWQVSGAVFHQRPTWTTGNFWAPEISRDDRGRFFVYYTAHKKDGPLCVAVASARRPDGPYKDHGPLVCQDAGSIDAMPVTDENGARYLLWKEDGNSRQQPTPIWAQKLSADGTRLIGERQEIIRNDAPWEAQLVEGPFVLRRGNWFYLFYSGNACCGRECNYALGVARSRKLLGPWEKNPANPILQGNETWKCPGHGSIVVDTRGKDYLLYHAYDSRDTVYPGRQALLDEVVWDKGSGWPSIDGGRGPSGRASSPFGVAEHNAEYEVFEKFTTPHLSPGWQWPQSNEPIIRLSRNQLVLSPGGDAGDVSDPLAAVVARSTTRGDYVATTVVNVRGMKTGAVAGLAAYGDRENALGVGVDASGRVSVWQREKNNTRQIGRTELKGTGLVYLRMRVKNGAVYSFDVSANGRDWKTAGENVRGEYLPPWDRGVRVALTSGGAAGAAAKFNWFRIHSESEKSMARVNNGK